MNTEKDNNAVNISAESEQRIVSSVIAQLRDLGVIGPQSAAYRAEAIPDAFQRCGVVFGKTVAARLVGGESTLYRLIERGKIRVEKKAMGAQNGKWSCNAADVIRHMKI